MGLCHLAIATFVYVHLPGYALIAMFVFLFAFQTTSGAITWLYCSEVAVDSALGFVGTFGYFTIFILTLTIQPMMDSKMGQGGTFLLFGVISLMAAVWCHFALKETSGDLTDKQKKELYMPEQYKSMKVDDSPEISEDELVDKNGQSWA